MKLKYVYIFFLIIICYVIYRVVTRYHNKWKFQRELFSESTYVKNNLDKYIKDIKDLPYINPDKPFLMQTYKDKKLIPKDVYINISKYAPGYKHVIYDDNDLISFLKKYFKQSVIDTFNSLTSGAHKADLARYCLLYVYGGLYLDVKTELVMPISEIFVEKDIFYSVISFMKDHVYQGIIHTPARNPLFLSLIDYIVHTQDPFLYLDFCKDLYHQIGNDMTELPEAGKKYKNFYFFQEDCSKTSSEMCYDGFDRYGVCCFIWDKDKPIIKTRRSTYPW
jgi:mannosyltransferase OCH1-like enzyme